MIDKEFYKRFFSIYIVLVLQNVITISVNLTDNIMLGAYGEYSLSGVASVNQIQFVFQQLIMALGDGLVIILWRKTHRLAYGMKATFLLTKTYKKYRIYV